jgi:hypothetical protein
MFPEECHMFPERCHMFPWVQATPLAYKRLCSLQLELALRLVSFRTQLAQHLMKHVNEPLLLKCPTQHLVKLSEVVYIFAGIIACFKAEAPDEFDPDAPITDAEYQVFLVHCVHYNVETERDGVHYYGGIERDGAYLCRHHRLLQGGGPGRVRSGRAHHGRRV